MVQAQSSSQVTIVGIPPILSSPYAEDLENSFVTGQYQVIFNYTSFTSQPVDFVFDFTVSKNNRTIIEIESLPQSFSPGTYVFTSFFEELIFPQSADDVFEQLDSEIQNQIIQTGTIPEGEYSIRIEARAATSSNIATIPGLANFSVRYPSPPILVSPPNGSNVTVDVPIFAWTPVVNTAGLQLEYEFLMVEVLDGQTPLQALNSNRAHTQSILNGNTTLPYTPEFLPLDEDSEYAWQITAGDAMGNIPFQNEGLTEIRTFTYRDQSGLPIGDLAQVEEIPIISQFATLIDLYQLSVTENPDSYEFNGPATMEFEFEGVGLIEVPVEVSGLQIQKTSLDTPVLMAGSASASAEFLEDILPEENQWIHFNELNWSFGENFTSSISILRPGNQWLQADGLLTVSRNGLSGTAEISGEPLYEYNEELFDLTYHSIGVSFPENRMWATGEGTILGENTSCELSNFSINGPQFNMEVLCPESFRVPLVEDNDILVVDVNRVLGTLSVNSETDDFGYDIELRSSLGLKTTNDEYCGVSLLMDISNEDGLEATATGDDCPEFAPEIDLGFSSLLIENTEFVDLTYASATGEWDFELGLDAWVEVDAFDQWSSLTMNDITVTRDGMEFGEFDFEEDFGITSLPTFSTPLLQLELSTFRLNEFTFPLFNWDGEGPGPWDISFGGSANVRPDSGAPESMVGQEVEVSDGRIEQDRVISTLSLPNPDNFEWNFGPGFTLNFTSLSGIAGLEYLDLGEIRPFGELNIGGNMMLGSPFNCGDEQMFEFSQDELSLSEGFSGQIDNIIPECPLQIGPFTAQVTQSYVEFSITPEGEQQAVMDAGAVIIMPDGLEVDGIVQIDLMTGELNEASFIIDEPFDWHIPSEEIPVLTFHLDYAELSEEGFFVDGRQTFLLPDTSMGVTFDNMLYDLQNGGIKSGRVIFDDSFGFEMGIPPNMQDLTFQSKAGGSELSLDPGLLMELGSTTYIDSLGFKTSGAAVASIAFNDQQYDSLVVAEYGEDFRMALDPFGITAGQVDFYFDDAHFAYLDPSGFHPVLSFFTDYLVPERLPLPTEDIAYLQLREGDSLLVDITPLEDGNLMISTPPDTSLDLVVPYLNPASPPTIGDVILNDLVISPNPFYAELISGSIVADLPPEDPTLSQALLSRGIPLTPQTIEYGIQDIEGTPTRALYLNGNLNLFGQELQSEEPSEFYLRGDGYVRANLNATGMDAELSLAPEDRIIFGVDAIDGSFEMAIGSSNPVYDYSITGGLEILTDQGYQTGADLILRRQPGYVGITDFTGYELDPAPTIGIEGFGLGLDQIVSLEEFSFSSGAGFQYSIMLNGHFNTGFANGEQLSVPFREIEFRNSGIYIPPQDINESSFPGLNLPEIDISGFEFQLLAFRTLNGITYNWGEGGSFDPDLSMDFVTDLPEFQQFNLIPPDGLLFTNVGFQNGFLVGQMEPFTPLGTVEVPVASNENSPILNVEELSGALEAVETETGFEQSASFSITGEVAQIPVFPNQDPGGCDENGDFYLDIVEGESFVGIINDIQPCGSLPLGPLSVEMTNADMILSRGETGQMAILDGDVDLTLPAPEGQSPVVVSGELTLDAITGEITNGEIAITEPFSLDLPFGVENPLFALTVNQAVLNMEGFTIDGQGSLVEGDVNADVTFDGLQFDLSTMEIVEGSASVNTNFAIQFIPNPFGFELVDADSPIPDDDVLRIDLSGDVFLDQAGLGFSGTSVATLQFAGQNYDDLRVEWLEDAAIALNGNELTHGLIEFYLDQGGQLAEDPLAFIDPFGFHMGEGILAVLPDRLGLPTEEIAYIQLKDENGNPYIEPQVTSTGYTLTTDGDFLPIVFPSLSSAGDSLTAAVSFSLETDDAFNIIDGSLELETELSLEDRLNLPVTLSQLQLNVTDGVQLDLGLIFDLPSVLNNYAEGTEAGLFATLGESGIEAGTFSLGDVSDAFNPAANPLYTFDFSGNVDGTSTSFNNYGEQENDYQYYASAGSDLYFENLNESMNTDTFSASLMGIEVSFGESGNSVGFTGTLYSSLVMDDENAPLFFSSSWDGSEWSFDLDTGSLTNELTIGQTIFTLDEYDGIELVSNENAFYVSLKGQVSFEGVLEEPIIVTVQDLQVGVSDYDSSPSFLFDIGSAISELGAQEFNLFDGALVMELIDPTISLSGSELVIMSDGNLQFLEEQIDYTGLEITTSGQFQLDEVSAEDIEIFQNYLVLQSFSLQLEDGLQLESELEMTLPAPADEHSGTGQLVMYRDDNGQIVVDQAGLQFDLDERFDLFGFGEFELTQLKAEVNPFEWQAAGVFANGKIFLDTQPDPIIEFGEASNFPNNAGIGIVYSGNQLDVQYNITGNVDFNFDLNFFSIAIESDISTASGSGFEILLSGEAGFNLEAVAASLNYGGIVITEEGLVDYGNITGGSINVADVVSLEVGQFIYEQNTTINLADTEEKSPDELQDSGDFDSGEVAANSVSVTEVLCFGPCPEVGGTNEGPALHLSINADPNNDSGGISGGVDKIMFYETTDGLRSLTIENAFIEIDSIFEMHASMNYMQDGNGGILLRAAAVGTFMDQVSALVAGKFSNLDGEISFGLFVAISSQAGIPIVPGIVTLTGAGGGFFYKPVQEDLTMVHDALAIFGHELVNEESASIQGQADFAVMLYASVGIAGSAGQYVVEGSTFFQITSQSFYMDARVAVLGMDGENSIAGTEISGAMAASIQRNPFAMSVSIEVNVTVPLVLEGGGGIEFFMTGEASNLAWGIVGHASFDVFEGVMTGGGEFLAGNPGVMLQVNLDFNLSIPLINVESSITGAIWIITDEAYEFPFGAYVVFDAEANIVGVLTVSAEAKAAFVTKSPGYEFFASAYGCVGVMGSEQCGSVWASYSNSGGLGYGTGAGEHADLVAQAGEQAEQFQNHIYALMGEIPAAAEAVEIPIPLSEYISDAETVARAGFNYYQLPQSQRFDWESEINTPAVLQTLPFMLQNVRNQVMRFPDPSYPEPSMSSYQTAATSAGNILEGLQDQISQDLITAYEIQASAQESMETLVSSMASSPVQSVTAPTPSLQTTQSVDFVINDDLVGQQIQSTEEYQVEVELLDQQIRDDIQNVLESLNEMSNLLQTDTPESGNIHLINMAQAYGEIYEEMERYFALDANKVWTDHAWAVDKIDYLTQNSASIDDAIEELSSDQQSLIQTYLDLNQAGLNAPSGTMNDYARQLANRENFILALSEVDINTTTGRTVPSFLNAVDLPNPASGAAPNSIQQIYDRFSAPLNSSVMSDFGTIEEINYNFWYEMNLRGLEMLRDSKFSLVMDVLFDNNDEYKEQVMTPLRNITQILDEFYSIKADVTAISYNMIDSYLVWREGMDDVDEDENLTVSDRQFNSYDAVAEFLAQQLEPPQITDITVYPNLPPSAFYNETDVAWTATHPDEIIETSVNIIYTSSDDTDISQGLDDYLSIGNRNQFTIYPYKLLSETRSINFGVRVRGSAGNTAIRRGIFTVDVHPEGTGSTTYGQSIVPENTPPPAPPIIELSEEYNLAEYQGESVYWTNQPANVELVLTAHDSQVGIGQWEYSVGTSQGATDVVDWTLLQGQVEYVPEIPAQRVTGPTQPLNLETGEQYYINARVRNSLGQQSEITSMRNPILLDSEAPFEIRFDYNAETPETPSPVITNVYDPVSSVPPFTQNTNVFNSWTDRYASPTILIENMSADDERSGTSHFEYIFSNDNDPPVNLFNAGDFEVADRELEYSGPELTFGSFVYWHVRAVDHAGNRNEINTFGPFSIVDRTLPEAGKLQAKVYADDVKLYIVEPPFDPESDITGIQYAISSSLTTQPDIRPFERPEIPDLEWSLDQSINHFERPGADDPRYISIRVDEFGNESGPLYILYRSVDSEGRPSNISASGPIFFDSTSPPGAQIQTSIDDRSGGIIIQVSNIRDPESGIEKVEYWVEEGPASGPGMWTNYFSVREMNLSGNPSGTMNGNAVTPEVDNNQGMSRWRVKIRITNRAGLSRVQTRDVDVPITVR